MHLADIIIGSKIFLSYLKLPDRLPAHLEYYSNGKAFDLEVKRPRRKASHAPLPSAEVRRLLPYAFKACIRIILFSTGKKIVPHGQERKTLKAREDGGEDKKSGPTRQ